MGCINHATLTVRKLCDAESLREELQQLKKVFKQNGYSHSDIRRPAAKLEPKLENKKSTGTSTIPLHRAIRNKISRLLRKYNTRTIHIPKRKTAEMLRSAKGGLKLKIQDVYRISCKCGKVYVGRSRRTVEKR
jgi:hypothetical protein